MLTLQLERPCSIDVVRRERDAERRAKATAERRAEQFALAKLATARQARPLVPKEVAPAFLSGWQAESLLRQMVATGRCDVRLSEFQRRWRMLWQATTGRW